MSHSFASSQELFAAVANLTTRLEAGGHAQAAIELREGQLRLNGLTDGWALFLEAIEKVEATHAARFSRDEQKILEVIRRAVKRAVYGRRG